MERHTTSSLAFWLVVIMLGLLTGLVVTLIWCISQAGNDEHGKAMLEFCKWALTTLLGTFGAWIGAGAAYHFGKENLAESSLSTERALEIQQQTLRGRVRGNRVKDLALIALNRKFMFDPSSTRQDVVDALGKNLNYWWVPVLDKPDHGKLADVIHARVFWDNQFDPKKTIAEISTELEGDPVTAKLHGASFYVRVASDELIADVALKMEKCGAAVGIVVDDKEQATYCFTKQDLMSAQT